MDIDIAFLPRSAYLFIAAQLQTRRIGQSIGAVLVLHQHGQEPALRRGCLQPGPELGQITRMHQITAHGGECQAEQGIDQTG